jgi:hypothetical protein
MALSKKIRFEIFKRDGFQCAYCGKTPPEVALEIDHIHPKSKKGKDDINNLITACFDCNRGKKNITLDKIPNKLNENLEILKIKEEQLKEYNKFIKIIDKRINNNVDYIESIFKECFPEYNFMQTFKFSIKRFFTNLSLREIEESMNIALSKEISADRTIKYFCGVCHNKIKNKNGLY